MSFDYTAIFPGLATDKDFKITSPETPDYNCIAWAYHYDDRWMWPGGVSEKTLDGFHFWPDDVSDSTDVQSFIDAFRLKGYSVCDDLDFNPQYRKIALYVKKGTTICTHAARELSNGLWSSKLGSGHDIQHGTPYSIEGQVYGVVYCLMRKPYK